MPLTSSLLEERLAARVEEAVLWEGGWLSVHTQWLAGMLASPGILCSPVHSRPPFVSLDAEEHFLWFTWKVRSHSVNSCDTAGRKYQEVRAV